jgi:predicted neutral ceramidase superfamily lipid hydrolase
MARPAPDPLVSLNVAAMSLVALGLLLAGFLAVYDWTTPGAEAPLVLSIGVVAIATLIVDLLVVSLRHLHRLRLGP